MSGAFTPGPWEPDANEMAQGADDIFTVSVWAAGQDGDRLHIAVVSAFSLLSETHGDTEIVTTDAPSVDKLTEAKANARLIAAAPELLAAGIEAAGCLSGCIDILHQIGKPKTAAVAKHMHDNLLAAIVKATSGAAP